MVFRFNNSGTHLAPPTSLTVAARSQLFKQIPGVVARLVVVANLIVDCGSFVVEVVPTLSVVVELLVSADAAAFFAASRSFSIEIGIAVGIDHPVNWVDDRFGHSFNFTVALLVLIVDDVVLFEFKNVGTVVVL